MSISSLMAGAAASAVGAVATSGRGTGERGRRCKEELRGFTIRDMQVRTFFRMSAVAALAAVMAFTVAAGAQSTDKRGRKYKAPPKTSKITVTVVRDASGKPIENAAVVFRAMVEEQKKGNMELKTNEDGKTVIDVIPTGDTLLLQVIAKGFQTFGGEFPVAKDDMAIEVRLKRPGEQYSIYKDKKPAQSEGKEVSPEKPAADPSKTEQPH